MRYFIADRQHYIIDRIEPKDGVIKSVYETMLGRECQIMTLKIGQPGTLLVDVGDHIFGLHRIILSNVLTVEGEDDLCIQTENTVYYLKSIAQTWKINRLYEASAWMVDTIHSAVLFLTLNTISQNISNVPLITQN